MSPAAPRAARGRRRPTSCWWARTAAMAWSATARRAIRSSGRSAPTSLGDAVRMAEHAPISATARRSIAAPSPSSAPKADLARFTPAEERVAVRMIHACGMVEIARDIVMSPGFAERRAPGAGRRRADPVRFQDGRERHHARAPAGRQRGGLHARRSGACPTSRAGSATRAPPRRWSCGATAWPARSSPSAMRRPRCSACSRCSMRAPSRRPP